MPSLASEPLSAQILWLFVLAIPVACVAWTITHEEIFRELHEYCVDHSKSCRRIYERKFFYALTCEFCLSHYVTLTLLLVTHYRLLYDAWRGYAIALFSIVWIANMYMAIFGRLRLEIKSQRLEIAQDEQELEKKKALRNKGLMG